MSISVYEIVTEKFIKALESGTIPWQKPWVGRPAFNRISGKTYSLLNRMMLQHSGEYATYKQWTALGGKPNKGGAEIVVFWKMDKKVQVDDDGNETYKFRPVLRYFQVWHISNVTGVEPLEEDRIETPAEPLEAAEKVIADYDAREPITFQIEESDSAYYAPHFDLIRLPELRQFRKAEQYYSTAFHEMIHSTGHHSRLNRFPEDQSLAAFGSEDYSKEELVAEIGAASLVNITGIETEASFQNSAAYVKSWLKALKNDPKMIVGAASKAEQAVQYILTGEKPKYN